MKITIKFFASIRENIGIGSCAYETAALTVGQLREELIAEGGAYAESLAMERSLRMALNHIMVESDAKLNDGSEIAFFPPVTGG